jgi:hypothetical protein
MTAGLGPDPRTHAPMGAMSDNPDITQTVAELRQATPGPWEVGGPTPWVSVILHLHHAAALRQRDGAGGG